MAISHLPIVLLSASLMLMNGVGANAEDGVLFNRPTDTESRSRVLRASTWLVDHVVRGKLHEDPELGEISIVAWHDPTLAPDDSSILAGYAITDTLWASRALTIYVPDKAKVLHASLAKLDCLRNNLHEVLFQPVAQICHRSGDLDQMHGSELGSLHRGDNIPCSDATAEATAIAILSKTVVRNAARRMR